MSVLVDTPIWSMFFRREGARNRQRGRLRELVEGKQGRIIGPVRQEILSGIHTPEQFARVRDGLRAFPDIPLGEVDFERAAEFSNMCRSHGLQGSNTDFLICAVAELNGLKVFTADGDFLRFARYLPIELF
jgi:predicted nucleic acid-binding protein